MSVEIGPSDIAGRGLFATAPLPAGTAVAGADAAANHGCDPNLWWDGAALVTRRDVAAGEELTWDYSTATADPDWLLRCHCGSTRCRQMVTGDDWRIGVLQQRYGAHWTPPLLAMIMQKGRL